jgi:type IV secretory pathway component VirB8
MAEIINNILDQEQIPEPKDFQRNKRLLWLSAAVSFILALVGYIIIVMLVLD